MSKAVTAKAERNRTIVISDEEISLYRKDLICLTSKIEEISNRTIWQDTFEALKFLPENHFALLFADPPYNLTKQFGENKFLQTSLEDYENWLDSWLVKTVKLLKKNASVYICGDWRSASAIQRIGMKYFKLRNRITWEREKGRGSNTNWKLYL
jgi:site-specific DNA-methyltransferase (adenine-specific)